MDIRQLKEETATLPNIEQLAEEFEQHYFPHITQHINKQHLLLHKLTPKQKKEFDGQLSQLKNFLHQIKYGQIVNEKITSLAHNLVELKIASLTNDHRKAKRLLNTFLRDEQLSIRRLIFEIPYLESQLSLLKQSTASILDQLSNSLPLEQKLKLTEGSHKQTLSNMLKVPKQQKKYLSLIGKNFITLMRDLKKKKEFRNFILKNI